MKKLMTYLLALTAQSNSLLQTDKPLSVEKLKY